MKLNPVEPPRYATRMPGGVGGAAPRGVPPIPIKISIAKYRRRCSLVGHRRKLLDAIATLRTNAGANARSPDASENFQRADHPWKTAPSAGKSL